MSLQLSVTDDCCRLCQHWMGGEAHVIDQMPAICRERTAPHLSRYPVRTYADELCGRFTDAARKAA